MLLFKILHMRHATIRSSLLRHANVQIFQVRHAIVQMFHIVQMFQMKYSA
jgi:hypothetical protein